MIYTYIFVIVTVQLLLYWCVVNNCKGNAVNDAMMLVTASPANEPNMEITACSVTPK